MGSMRVTEVIHEIDCTPEAFWPFFWDDDAFNEAMYREGLHYRSCEILERTPTFRRIRLVPKLDLPRPVLRVIGDQFAYEDHATLDRTEHELRWKMVPNRMADRLHMAGSMTLSPTPNERSSLRYQVELDARLPGVGKLLEREMEDEVRRSWEQETSFIQRYLRERG